MRKLIQKRFYILLCVAMGQAAAGCALAVEAVPAEIRQEEALKIAEETPEVQALYALEGSRGRMAGCVEKRAERPCDSQWVTCIEDAWVIKFIVGAACGIRHDGRLNETILIDSLTGKIISRYPEVDYFFDPQFCRDHHDCMNFENGEDKKCRNFIHGQLQSGSPAAHGCECLEGMCVALSKPKEDV